MSQPINFLEQQRLCSHPLDRQEIKPMIDGGAYRRCVDCGKILETVNPARRYGLD